MIGPRRAGRPRPRRQPGCVRLPKEGAGGGARRRSSPKGAKTGGCRGRTQSGERDLNVPCVWKTSSALPRLRCTRSRGWVGRRKAGKRERPTVTLLLFFFPGAAAAAELGRLFQK